MTKRKAPPQVPDLDRTMRLLIAPWELPALYDGDSYAFTHLSQTVRGTYGSGGGRRVCKKGLEQILPTGETETVHLFPWKEVKARLQTMSPAAIDRLRAANKASSAHMATFPVFAATGIAVGCGPFFGSASRGYAKPLTPAQEEYVRQHDEHWVRVDEYYERGVPIGAERDAAHDACYSESVFGVDVQGELEWVL
jgi:hypothetical protein